MEIIYCNRGSLSLILFSMRFMLCKVLNIAVSQRLVPLENQEVFSILLFSSFREIERAGQQRDAVDNDDLVMRNCMYCIDVSWYACMSKEISSSVFLPPLALVQNRNNLDPLFSLHQPALLQSVLK